jgi:hypothetical protein
VVDGEWNLAHGAVISARQYVELPAA